MRKNKAKTKKKSSEIKKNNLLHSLQTKLDKCIEEAQSIRMKLDTAELSESDKALLMEKLTSLEHSIQYYENEIPSVEAYGTHKFNTNMPTKKKRRPWINIIYTPMGNKR